MKSKLNIFVISDNHFNHWKINKYCNRKFKNLEEMNEIMIKKWNSTIRPQDLIIHLGDIVFTKGKSENIKNILKQLKGKKILVMGNHDRKNKTWYLTNGFDFVCDRMIWRYNNRKILFIHNKNSATYNDYRTCDFIICGHSHNKGKMYNRKRKSILVNVSVEQVNYTPQLLISILNNKEVKNV